ncbi:MAG: hypothetical protein LBR32_03540 [Propionibacteriaceae bacterium]|jgi:hypothetical protein|nr:hypothetical protein [Propionibacteriaceae bacterium]
MDAQPIRIALVAAACLALSACAVQSPEASGTLAGGAGVVTGQSGQPAAQPSQTGAGEPTTPADATVQPSASPTPLEPIILAGDSVAGLPFKKTAEDDVAKLLTAELGPADDDYSGPFCELDPDTPYSRTLTYGGLSVLFLAKDDKSDSERYLNGWSFNLEENMVEPITLAEGLTTSLSFQELAAKFPKGKLEHNDLIGDEGYTFTTPGGIKLNGNGSVEWISAGFDSMCE